jgi:hypothetical protein
VKATVAEVREATGVSEVKSTVAEIRDAANPRKVFSSMTDTASPDGKPAKTDQTK